MNNSLPQVSYTLRKNLGNYEFEELTLTIPAANGSVEEIDNTMEYVMESVKSKLQFPPKKDKQEVDETSIF